MNPHTKNRRSQSGVFIPRVFLAFALCSVGVLLAMLSFAAPPPSGRTESVANSPRDSFFVDKHAGPLSGADSSQGWFAANNYSGPSPRTYTAMAYYREKHATALFGGNYQQGFGGDTWVFDGQRWTQLNPAMAPSPRSGHAMVYDAARQH